MISFLGFVKRALEGSHCSEMDFDLDFDRNMRETVKKYGIKYDPENPIPSDDQMADNVFQAGLEFYERVGNYCVNSQRTIKFTRKEILEALAEAPAEPVFGEGKDAKKLTARPPESDQPPWCHIGAAGIAVTDEGILSALVEAYGSILLGDAITTPAIQKVNGLKIVANTPLEILGCIRTVECSREALRKAGRPGMPIMNSIATAVSDTAKIAASQFGLRPSDGWLIGCMAEMKFNFQRLNEIAYVSYRGGHIVAEVGPLLGGYCGGPEGLAVANVAYHFQAIMVQRGSCHFTFPVHFKYGINSTRDTLWASSISNQAISRNSHFPLLTASILAAGPGTEMCFHENAARMITTCVSGGGMTGVGLARSVRIDHVSPLEPRFSAEVAHASVGIKRETANEIVKDLLSRYESKIPEAPLGKRFQDLYNVETLEPNSEHADLYERMKDAMRNYGLKFKA